MIRTIVFAAAAMTMLGAATHLLAVPQKKKVAKPAPAPVTANAKQENQFVTVDEFVTADRPTKIAVSVEGYAVSAYRSADGGVQMVLVDSVDHVLSPADANNFGLRGARATIPASALKKHFAWAFIPKGVQRFSMYSANGVGLAQKQLHDIVPKVRLTGFAIGKTISPVTKVEFQDENGDWKQL